MTGSVWGELGKAPGQGKEDAEWAIAQLLRLNEAALPLVYRPGENDGPEIQLTDEGWIDTTNIRLEGIALPCALYTLQSGLLDPERENPILCAGERWNAGCPYQHRYCNIRTENRQGT